MFITRMKEYRKRHNISQIELAELVGCRRETIIKVEKGQYNPSLKLAMDIASALKTSVYELFFFIPDEPDHLSVESCRKPRVSHHS